jgi:hypothetical protein
MRDGGSGLGVAPKDTGHIVGTGLAPTGEGAVASANARSRKGRTAGRPTERGLRPFLLESRCPR